MPEKRDVDAEQSRQIDDFGLDVVRLLRKGLAERPFGRLTVSFHWKAGLLSKLEVNEMGERLITLPQRQ